MKRLREVLLTALAAVLPFAMAEGGLRLAGWRPADDWYFHGFVDEGGPLRERDGVMEVVPSLRTVFRAAPFPTARETGEVRLVAVGDSVTWGHRSNEDPEPLHAWPDALQDLLRARPDGGADRVVNLAARAYSSRRVEGVVRWALELRPDAILASFGSSEYLEEATRREWEAREARRPAWFWRLRVVEALEALLSRMRGGPARGLSAQGLRERDERLEAAWLATGTALPGPGEAARLLEEAGARVERMARACEAAGVPLVLLTVPSNLRWPPEASRYADEQERQVAGEAVRHAGALLEAGRADEARALLEPLVRAHPAVASLRFRLAQALDREAETEAARREYEAARDLSAFPLRAQSALNDRFRQVAEAHPSAVLVDIDRLCRDWVPDGIPDDRIFLDQNHLREEAHRRVAEAVLAALVARGIVPPERGAR